MMWQRFQEEIERGGGQVRLNSEAIRLQRDNDTIKSIIIRSDREKSEEISINHVIFEESGQLCISHYCFYVKQEEQNVSPF